MARPKSKFKSVKTIVTEVEVPPVESISHEDTIDVTPAVKTADPMALLLQATAQLAQWMNAMLEGQKLQTDALIAIKEWMAETTAARKLSEQELRILQEEKPLHIASRQYFVQPVTWYDAEMKPFYGDAVGPIFKSQEEADAFGTEKIWAGKYRTYHQSSIAAIA